MSSRSLLLAVTLALVLLPSQLAAGALPLMRSDFRASATELGWVVAAYQLGYALAVIVVLPLTDRFRASRVIAAGALVTSLANLAFAFAAVDVITASLLRVLAGFGLAGVYMPGVRLVAESAAPGRRGFAVGAYVAAFYLGGSVSFYATGILLTPFGWQGASLVLALVGFSALPLAIVSARDLRETSGERAHLDPSVLRHGPLLRTIVAYGGHSWELFVVRAWLAAFLAAALLTTGLTQTEASAIASQWAAIMLALGVLGVFLGGWISDRFGRARSAFAIALLSGLVSLGYGALIDAPFGAIVVIGTLYGGLIGADSAIYSTAVTELAPVRRIGSAQAVQAFAGFGVGSLGPVLAGASLDLGAGWMGPFVVAGSVGLLSALPLLRLLRPPP